MLWGGAETLILVSSDLSHYHDYLTAQRIDTATSQAICKLEGAINGEQACGCYAINGFIDAAREHHLQAQQLDLRNSGDTAGDRSKVVGYGSYVLH